MLRFKLITPLCLILISFFAVSQTTRNAGTATELTNAISASANGDIINITNNIVISAQVSISGKTITINGNNYEITVPRPGLDDMGRFNSSPSAFRVFDLSSSSSVSINDLKIKGGATASNGGAISVPNGNTLRLNNCVVSNSRTDGFLGGGGIAVSGLLFVNNSFILRNGSGYGGGILVTGTGRAFIENSTLSENRSTSSNGGGGAAECQSGSILYFNNSTLSNNQSTEIGGAINNYQGTVYFINSSATGNVAFGGFNGGAIGNNGGNLFILNSLFSHNYRRTSGTVTNPTGYVLDDFQPHSNPAGIRVYHSIYQATLPSGLAVNTGNVQYMGAANGSDNTIFSGGLLSKITDNDGNEIGDAVFRPFLVNNQGSIAPTLKVGSFLSDSGNRGVPTRFDNNNNLSPAIGFFSGGTWTDILGTSQDGQEVLTDQVGSTRSSTTPTRGAIESELNATLFIVKVNGASGGTVNGGTIYGDVYPSGTSVTLTAIPNSGQEFVRWDYVAGGVGTASTANPYTFTVTSDVTLVPVFQTLAAGSYTITYIGNGNTGGTVPAGGTFSAPTTIAAPGTLTRTGFTFAGWNTNSNGSGTSYASGDTYSAGTNLTLYAQWTEALSINNILVNEGSDWAVFTINGRAGDIITLNLRQQTGVGKADLGSTPVIQIWNGTAWINYLKDDLITIPATRVVYARVDITNEQDNIFEGPETFQLEVVPIPPDIAGLTIFDANFQTFTLDNYTRTGTDGAVGTTYKKDNAITISGQQIDVVITIDAKVNVSSFTFDDNGTNSSRFQPQINSSSASGSYVDFSFDFFKSGTNERLAIKNFVVNPVDVDGNSSTNKEFIELFNISTYQLGTGSGLTVIENPNGRTGFTRFEGINTSLPGVTFDNTASFIAFYSNPVSRFEMRMGVTGSSSATRLFSMSIGSAIGTFDNPSSIDIDPILGTATIIDDGTGSFWIGNNRLPATETELIAANITLDDDRSPNIVNPDVNSAFVNEARAGSVATNDQMPVGTTYSTTTVLANATLTLSANGSYTFTATAPGVYVYNFEACNPTTPPVCTTETLTITVLAVDATNAPPVANTDFAVGIQGSPVTVKTLANDDAGTAGAALVPSSVSIVSGTPNPITQGTLSVDATTGDITFTPVAGFTGSLTYAYQVCDTNTPSACATATQTVTIYPTGSANIVAAADDYNLTYQGASVSGNVLTNDTQVKAGTLAVTAQTTTLPGVGTLTLSANGSYTFVPDPAFKGNTSFVYEVTGVDGVKAYATLYISVAETPTFNWTGAGDPEDWCDPENWDKGTVPSTAVNVTVKYDATNPKVKLSGTCDLCIKDLDVQSGATLEVVGIQLCVTGDVTSAGLIDGTGSIHLKGTTLQTISGNFSITNLELENPAGAVITSGAGNMVQITEKLILKRGNLTTNDNLRLMSDASGDAYIAPISDADCALTGIIGNVRVQKFVNGGNRAFRMIAHPFNGTISLQQIRDYVHITGQGLDFNDTGNPSAFWYLTTSGNQASNEEDSGWVPVTSTSLGDWFKGRAVRMMIRGPRTQGGVVGDDDYIPQVVTYELIGEVNLCEQILTGLRRVGTPGDPAGLPGNSAYNFIGNPFPAGINLKTIPLADRVDVGANYYIWQPRTGLQGGQTVFGPGGGRGGSYWTEPFEGGDSELGELAMGTGFFVVANEDNARIRFTEANKIARKNLAPGAKITFRAESQSSRYGANTVQISLENGGAVVDRVLLYFGDEYAAKTDQWDAFKFQNPGLNFFTVSEDDYALAIDRRPWVENKEYIVPLYIQSPAVEYTLKVPDFDLQTGRKLYLLDRFNSTKVEIKAGMEYKFSVTADPKSKDHRFDIIMGADVVTSLDKSVNGFNVFLLPNPAQQQVAISIARGEQPLDLNVRVYDSRGIKLFETQIAPDAEARVDYQVDRLPKGMYLVEVQQGKQRVVKKLVVN